MASGEAQHPLGEYSEVKASQAEAAEDPQQLIDSVGAAVDAGKSALSCPNRPLCCVVPPMVLEQYFKSKFDLYKYYTEHKQLFLPSYRHTRVGKRPILS